jgi:hypothetical protein
MNIKAMKILLSSIKVHFGHVLYPILFLALKYFKVITKEKISNVNFEGRGS